MPYTLIGENMALEIGIGGLADGTPPVFTDSLSFMGKCKKVGIESGVEKLNVKAMGDGTKRHRYHSQSGMLDLEGFVKSTGYALFGTGGSYSGYYIRVRTKEISSMSAFREWIGVIEHWNHDTGSGQDQTEKIKIDLNPDF